MEKLFSIYKRMLELNIWTKTTDLLFNKASMWFYELLFTVFKQISEKRQDNEIDATITSKMAWIEANSLLKDAKEELEKMIKEDNSLGMDNLLGHLLDKLEVAYGSSKCFIQEEEIKEKEEEKEEEKQQKEEEEISTKKGMPYKK